MQVYAGLHGASPLPRRSGLVLKTEHSVCIKNISEGKDIFLRLPTDFGKYICYEVLPFVLDSAASELSCLGQLRHVRTRPFVKKVSHPG